MVHVGRLHPSLAERKRAREVCRCVYAHPRSQRGHTHTGNIGLRIPGPQDRQSPQNRTITNTSNSTVRIRTFSPQASTLQRQTPAKALCRRERTVLSGLHSRLRSPVPPCGPSSSPILILPVLTF